MSPRDENFERVAERQMKYVASAHSPQGKQFPLPSCMGGCGKYPYVHDWHNWTGGWCNLCWKRHEESLQRMAAMEKRFERKRELDKLRERRANFSLFVAFSLFLLTIAFLRWWQSV